ncbi:MAG: hypothetical protein H0V30_01165 [Chitinophagaceae bacterium]|jgi:hypothetical protein|nr:hypothetical protein [Chitinophagaceae bacterium]
MTDRNKDINKEEWRNREDQDLRKDINRQNPKEKSGRDTFEEEEKEKKIANIPGSSQADTSSSKSNNMSTGGLTNSRKSRERTRVPGSKKSITGSDDDGQSV